MLAPCESCTLEKERAKAWRRVYRAQLTLDRVDLRGCSPETVERAALYLGEQIKIALHWDQIKC